MKHAIIMDGRVVNIVLWDGVEPWSPPNGGTLIMECPDNVGIGWTYEDGEFSPPA